MSSGIMLADGEIRIKKNDLALFGKDAGIRKVLEDRTSLIFGLNDETNGKEMLAWTGIVLNGTDENPKEENNDFYIFGIGSDEDASIYFFEIMEAAAPFVTSGWIEYDNQNEREMLTFTEGKLARSYAHILWNTPVTEKKDQELLTSYTLDYGVGVIAEAEGIDDYASIEVKVNGVVVPANSVEITFMKYKEEN